MQLDLSPEIVRIAQIRAEQLGLELADELARVAFEEMIFNLDPDLGYLVDQEESLNSADIMASALGCNDVVINEHRVDIRALNDQDELLVPRVLLNSPALNNGTFAVRLEDNKTARIVGYVSVGALISSTDYTEDRSATILKVAPDNNFDLANILEQITRRVQIPLTNAVSVLPNGEELKSFFNNIEDITPQRRKQIITAICAHDEIRNFVKTFPVDLSRGTISKVLRSGSRWNKTTEELSVSLSTKYSKLTRDDIKNTLTELGETYGGQPEAPAFAKAARRKLTMEQLGRSLGQEKLARMKSIIDQVLDGKTVADAVKEKVKNSFAVDVAITIKKNREAAGSLMESFVTASAEEIGKAFQQLAVQPAYATHSSSTDNGVDSINEALEILESCKALEELQD